MRPHNVLDSVSQVIFTDMLSAADNLQREQAISEQHTKSVQSNNEQMFPFKKADNKEVLRNRLISKITTLRTQRIDECVFNALCRSLEGAQEGYVSLNMLCRATSLSRCTIVNSIKRLVSQDRLKKYSDSSPEKGFLTNFFVICEK